tara:strand:- start:153 stop:605 length:453 start_codon:yes stop_codon:yes gene_type:complete
MDLYINSPIGFLVVGFQNNRGYGMNNEKESFNEFYYIGKKCDTIFDNRDGFENDYYNCEETWNHQQKKIDQLEHDLKMHKKLTSDYYPLNEFIQKRGTKVNQLGKNYGDVAIEEIQELEELLKEAVDCIDSSWHEDFLDKPEIIKLMEKV